MAERVCWTDNLLERKHRILTNNTTVLMEDKWISVETKLPEEGGRYWCYVEELNDLGISHYQWNCSYNETEKRFRVEKGGRVTHWTHLLPSPTIEQ